MGCTNVSGMAGKHKMTRPKILFLVTEDWYFCSHRLPLARKAKLEGYDVVVATHVNNHGIQIVSEGLFLIPIRMRRRSTGPLHELLSLFELVALYKTEKPDIVHHVAFKPVLFGGVAAQLARVPGVVNAIAGMGYLFSSSQWKAKFLGYFVKLILKYILNRPNSRTIVQNPDDQIMLIQSGITKPALTALIRGSGVDTEVFSPVHEPTGVITVVLASRMLWDKGIGEFVEAAALMKREGVEGRFVLVGDPDSDNPTSITKTQLETWSGTGIVEWWGKCENMPEVFAESHIVCLPSYYGEGIPKVLIEAASCARPIVTTDMPGCKEIVQDGENGFLVPPRDVAALADALKKLIGDKLLRRKMGEKGREYVINEFSIQRVTRDTIAVYRSLLQ
jgi:glycosyltransferase involved in cell wall biosynthesis